MKFEFEVLWHMLGIHWCAEFDSLSMTVVEAHSYDEAKELFKKANEGATVWSVDFKNDPSRIKLSSREEDLLVNMVVRFNRNEEIQLCKNSHNPDARTISGLIKKGMIFAKTQDSWVVSDFGLTRSKSIY